jgi:hypothetical protein
VVNVEIAVGRDIVHEHFGVVRIELGKLNSVDMQEGPGGRPRRRLVPVNESQAYADTPCARGDPAALTSAMASERVWGRL